MQIPNRSAAYIPVEKLRDYILSPAHPTGRFKFAFFRSLGYEPDDFERLATDIRAMLGADAELVETTRFGSKYRVSSTLTGPNGRSAAVVAIWIILSGHTAPRFVTAYPEG
jgi:hypothetical protein